MSSTLLLVCLVLMTGLLAAARERSPALIWALYWTVIIAMHLLLPLGLVPLTDRAALIVGTGVVAFAVGGLLSRRRPPRTSREIASPPGSSAAARFRFPCAAILSCVLLFYGLLAFRTQISNLAQADFGSLDVVQVRRIQSGIAPGTSGIGQLFISLAPLVACLGIYGVMRVHRMWFVLVPYALYVTTRSPGRTLTIGVVAASVAFFIYLRQPRQSAAGRARLAAVISVAGAGAVLYFQVVGNKLGKTSLISSGLPKSWIPDALVTPLVYQLGGLSALSVADLYSLNPTEGQRGRSAYVFYRALSTIVPAVHAPTTVAQFVPVPVPFNVFTGFGDVFYDYGFVGLVVVFALLGWLTSASHRRAKSGSLISAWCAAVLWSIIVTASISLRLFYIDTVFLAAVGSLFFAALDGPGAAGLAGSTLRGRRVHSNQAHFSAVGPRGTGFPQGGPARAPASGAVGSERG